MALLRSTWTILRVQASVVGLSPVPRAEAGGVTERANGRRSGRVLVGLDGVPVALLERAAPMSFWRLPGRGLPS